MQTIWKYQLQLSSQQIIQMPRGALILSAQTQNDILCLWAVVNPENPPALCRVLIIGTGHPVPDLKGLRFIDTVQMMRGGLIWHIFAGEEWTETASKPS